MKTLLKIFRSGIFWVIQIFLVIILTLLTQKVLESIPVPGVLKSLSIIQLDDLNSSVLQTAADLRTKMTGEAGVDSNIIIINNEHYNPTIKRGEIAKAIRFLKDNGAKTIALDIAMDYKIDPASGLDTNWDYELAEAIKYAGNVVTLNGLNEFTDTLGRKDTLLSLSPHPIFSSVLADTGYANLEPPYSEGNPGGVIQFFFPNCDYKGKMIQSFPLAIVKNYDSSKAKKLGDYTEKMYLNFYQKSSFKTIWDLSLISNPISSEFFKEHVKGRIFIFGYINPDEELLKTSMYATPVGKLDYVVVFASIVSDLVKGKFVQESPPMVDLGLGAVLCLFNLIFIRFASRRTLMWEKFTGGLLVLSEVLSLYFIVVAVYLVFDYELSIIILSIVCFISVPTITLIYNRLIPLYNKFRMYSNIYKYPYPVIQPYMSIFEFNKRSVRNIVTVYEFQRMFNLIAGISICAARKPEEYLLQQSSENKVEKTSESDIKTKNEPGEIVCPKKLLNLEDWDKLKEFNLNNSSNEINKNIYGIIGKFKYVNILNGKIVSDYNRLFSESSLAGELYLGVEKEKDMQPYLDPFAQNKKIFKSLALKYAEMFKDYSFIFVTKGEPGNYLIRSLKRGSAPAGFIKTQKKLLPKNIYIMKKSQDEFICLSPYIQYRMCKYHLQREIFVYLENKFNPITGKPETKFLGEYFMCYPESQSLFDPEE